MKGGVWRFTSVVKRKEERNSSQNPFKESKRVGLKMSSAETTLESTLTEPYSKGGVLWPSQCRGGRAGARRWFVLLKNCLEAQVLSHPKDSAARGCFVPG